MDIGRKIFELRKKKQMTQKELAARIGISEQAVSKWERDAACPDLFLIPTLAEIFGVSTDELFGFATGTCGEGAQTAVAQAQNSHTEARVEYLEKLLSMALSGNPEEAYREELSRAKPLLSFDFTKMSDAERALWEVKNADILEQNGKMLIQSKPVEIVIGKWYDPQIKNDKLSIDVTNTMGISIRIKTVSAASHATLQIYFKTEDDPKYDERKICVYQYLTNTTVNVNIRMSNPALHGKLTGLRIDPARDEADYSKIENVALINDCGEVIYVFDFTDPDADISNWEFVNATPVDREHGIGVRHDPYDRAKVTHDPILERGNLDFDIGKAKHVHVRLKTDLDDNPDMYNVVMGIYFKTEASNTYNRAKIVTCQYVAGCGMLDLYADMSQSPFWTGKLTALRIDPVENRAGRFEIELVEILEPTADARSAGIITGYDKQIKEMQSLIEDYECRLCDLESRIDDLECRIDDLESSDK